MHRLKPHQSDRALRVRLLAFKGPAGLLGRRIYPFVAVLCFCPVLQLSASGAGSQSVTQAICKPTPPARCQTLLIIVRSCCEQNCRPSLIIPIQRRRCVVSGAPIAEIQDTRKRTSYMAQLSPKTTGTSLYAPFLICKLHFDIAGQDAER